MAIVTNYNWVDFYSISTELMFSFCKQNKMQKLNLNMNIFKAYMSEKSLP